MADLLPDLSTLEEAGNNLAGAFGLPKPFKAGLDPIYSEEGVDLAWTIDGSDWYKVFAYQFVVTAKSGETFDADPLGTNNNAGSGSNPSTEFLYTLPIPPQNIATRMVPASQVTPTVGGVVEETGANVFWLINMAGTTGIAVSRGSNTSPKRSQVAKQFRDKITTTGLMSGALAGVNSAISKIGGVADSILNLSKANGLQDVSSGVVGAVNTALLPPLPYAGSGVNQSTNGYTEMHELHRFLYTYSQLKQKNPGKYGLKFRNYKSNQEWDCVLQDFQILQSSANPMLYKYAISLKCWNVGMPGGDRKNAEYDRFGPGGDLAAVSTIDPQQMTKLYQSLINKNTGNSVSFLLGK